MGSDWPQKELVQAIAGECEGNPARCSVVVGAGLSQEAGYIGWSQLMMQMVELCAPGRSKNYIAEMRKLAMTDPLGFASWARQQNRQGYFELLAKCFGQEGKKSFTSCHRYLLQTRFQYYMTTNFDCCLENCAMKLKQTSGGVFYYPDYINSTAIYNREGAICHLQGFLYRYDQYGTEIRRCPDELVLAYEDYFKIYNDVNSQIRILLESMLREQTVLFVGFSFSDPVWQRLLEKLTLLLRSPSGMNRDKHYALLPQTQHIKSSQFQKEIFRDRYSIAVEFFPTATRNKKTDFSQLAEYLKQLRDAVISYRKRINKKKPNTP